MIEVRNIDHADKLDKKNGNFYRAHILDSIDSLAICDEPVDDIFAVLIDFNNRGQKFGKFDSYEKAEKFYDAMKGLLVAGTGVIDIKDYE